MSDEERGTIKFKLESIDYCIFSDDALWDGPAWEDVACHLFDMLEICRQNIARRVPEFESNEKFISYYSGAFSSVNEGRGRRLVVKKYAGTITPEEEDELDSCIVKGTVPRGTVDTKTPGKQA
jgi:hypothetical protein